MLINHQPNPDHPNYGRPQSSRAYLASRLNWMTFQLRGALGNLGSAVDTLQQAKRGLGKGQLTPEAEQEVTKLVQDAVEARIALAELVDRIALLQKSKKWVD